MTKQQIMHIQSSLFAPELIESDDFVIEQQPVQGVTLYQQTLMMHKRALHFTQHYLGLSLEVIKQHHVGYAPEHDELANIKDAQTKDTHLGGCITLPLHQKRGVSGYYGLRFNGHSDNNQPIAAYVAYAQMPIYAPFLTSSIALLFDTPFDVLAFSSMGYSNSVSVLGSGITDMALSALMQRGVTHLVSFSHALTDQDELAESTQLAKHHHIELLTVHLPFVVSYCGQWDQAQWRLFDKRITELMLSLGRYNDRYHA